MTIPTYEELLLPVLKCAGKGDVRIGDATSALADDFKLTDAEREALLPSARQAVFTNRVHWAKTYLKQAGLIENPSRGVMRITRRGREVLTREPPFLDCSFLDQFQEFREFRSRRRPENSPSMDLAASAPPTRSDFSPEEEISNAISTLEAQLTEELLDRVRLLSAAAFERLVVELLTGLGYGGSRAETARSLGRSGDDGVDGVIDQDTLGLDQIYVQAKRWKGGANVGAGEIRDFYGALDLKRASKGLFVTTADFTPDARRTAGQLGKKIVLMNGSELAAQMIRHRVGCRTAETVEIKRLDDDFFESLS